MAENVKCPICGSPATLEESGWCFCQNTACLCAWSVMCTDKIAAVTAERDALAAQLAEAERVAEAATEVYLKKFDADTATMELKSEAFRNFAEMAYSYAEACGMKNYVEATVLIDRLAAKGGAEEFFMTLQRCQGKTPHELKVEAERERDEARTRAASWEIRCVSKEEQLAALKKRVAYAPRRRFRADSTEAPQRKAWFALVRLEDGE